MNQSAPPSRTKSDKLSQLANVALLYYGEGLTQSEIAKRMQVSRATIVNMLKDGRDNGIVEIRVDGKHLSSSSLARDMRDRFGLEDVYIATSDKRQGTQDRASLLAQVGRVGAAAALDIVEPNDRVGVAWGETISAVAEMMPPSPISGVEVCQLLGSMNSVRIPASENCAIQIAGRLDAKCFTLHAPGIVGTSEIADVFRNEPTINEQLGRLSNLDMSIVSIGHVLNDTHLMAAEMVSEDEFASAKKRGAVGIICCRFIDEAGNRIPSPLEDRLIAASMDNLRSATKKLLVVFGNDRVEATLAAIHGGLVTHLCIDEALAIEILNTQTD